jgi:hypothetical protein
MPSRYICEIHDDIDEAIKKLRIDLIPGLCEEARVAGKRMEARLKDYSSMKYDLRRARELKKLIAEYKLTSEFLEANLELPEFDGNEDDDIFDEVMDE